MKLSQIRLKQLLRYDPCTGIFMWNDCAAGHVKLKKAGNIQPNGYVRICIDGKKYYAHRLAWLYLYGYCPENVLDHKDRNRANNCIDNLREVSQSCNMHNAEVKSNNKTGVTGVCWSNAANKWLAQIHVDGSQNALGYFINFDDVVKARWEAEKKYGFPNCNTISTSYLFLENRGLI